MTINLGVPGLDEQIPGLNTDYHGVDPPEIDFGTNLDLAGINLPNLDDIGLPSLDPPSIDWPRIDFDNLVPDLQFEVPTLEELAEDLKEIAIELLAFGIAPWATALLSAYFFFLHAQGIGEVETYSKTFANLVATILSKRKFS